MPPFLKTSVQALVEDTIRESYRQANRYDLTGLARVDFFGLYEFTRRKGSAVHAYQSRLLIVPFLNPDYIRAVLATLTAATAMCSHSTSFGSMPPNGPGCRITKSWSEKRSRLKTALQFFRLTRNS